MLLESCVCFVHGGNRLGGNFDLVVFGRCTGLHIEDSFKQGIGISDPTENINDAKKHKPRQLRTRWRKFFHHQKRCSRSNAIEFGVFKFSKNMENRN